MVKFYAAWSAGDLAKIARDLANTHYFKIPTTADEFKEEAATATTSVVRLILGLFPTAVALAGSRQSDADK